jgi:ribosomal peptide maturation radical SAM protein 1
MKIAAFDRIGLISAPWPIYSRPSIQIAALKAYLDRHCPELEVDPHPFYLRLAASIGYRVYQDICERTWPAEAVYAALLYPERFEEIERFFRARGRTETALKAIDFESLAGQVREATDQFIAETDWHRYGLIGFSICLCQLTASLYLIRRIKSRCSGLKIVVGGSMVAGKTLPGMLRAFPQIDFGINGEGEIPLRRLVEHLRFSGKTGPVKIPGVVGPADAGKDMSPARNQIEDLSDLPFPDFDAYFQLLGRLPAQQRFFPTLPVEMSRGCWWGRPNADTGHTGCAFCNLNLQWHGYRHKPPPRMTAEIDALTRRHQCLSVAFMDNLLPLKASARLFDGLAQSKAQRRMFCEIRATTPYHNLEKMKRAGVAEIQIGIEALSTRLLRKLNKGTTAIQNLEVMRHCEELGLANSANLIVQFPGSSRADVDQTLTAIEFALPFRPLRVVKFWLGLDSPVWQNPKAFGIHAVFNHPHWRALLGAETASRLVLPLQSYRGDRVHQRKLWKPVRDRVRQWQQAYDRLHQGALSEPILSYRDGGEFMILRQKRLDADPMTHRLVGLSRRIYLFCRRRRSLDAVSAQFPGVDPERILDFLRMMVNKRLMFEEDRVFLSLAVAVYPWSSR